MTTGGHGPAFVRVFAVRYHAEKVLLVKLERLRRDGAALESPVEKHIRSLIGDTAGNMIKQIS